MGDRQPFLAFLLDAKGGVLQWQDNAYINRKAFREKVIQSLLSLLHAI